MGLPAKGEFWEVVADGTAKGTVMEIIDLPETQPNENPFVVVRIAGQDDTHRLPLDNRWGTGIIKTRAPSPDARLKVARKAAKDRLVRIGVGTYGLNDIEKVMCRIITDYLVAGRGSELSLLISTAREMADEAEEKAR